MSQHDKIKQSATVMSLKGDWNIKHIFSIITHSINWYIIRLQDTQKEHKYDKIQMQLEKLIRKGNFVDFTKVANLFFLPRTAKGIINSDDRIVRLYNLDN